MVGLYISRSDNVKQTRYFHKDHLGAISVITKEDSTIEERQVAPIRLHKFSAALARMLLISASVRQ